MRASSLLYSAALILCSSAFSAPVACTVASVDVYVQQTEGCTIGQFTIKNFAWSSVDDIGYLPVSASQVFVNPQLNGNNIEVGFTSDNFEVTSGLRIRAFLDYTIDPPPPILDDLNLEMDANSPVAPGFARITANICIGGLFSNSCANGIARTLTVEHFGAGDPNNVLIDTEQFPFPVNLIDVRTIIELEARTGSSQIGGYGTITTAIQQDEIPEPSTAALLLSGLGGAIYLRSRRLRS